MSHKNAELALEANVRIGRIKKCREFYTAVNPVPHTLRTWDLLGERLMQRMQHGERRQRYGDIWLRYVQPESYEGGA